jgi:type I restriction enzyme, S subunit
MVEQLQLVARIEEMGAQTNDARELRHQAAEETEALVGAEAASIFRAALKKGNQPLGSVTKLERGKFSHRPRNEPRFFGGAHPWIQIGEIESSGKFIRDWTQTLNDEGLAISKKFPRGTVLISIAATIGAVGILDFDCCIPDSIVGVTPSEGTDSEFIYHYLGYFAATWRKLHRRVRRRTSISRFSRCCRCRKLHFPSNTGLLPIWTACKNGKMA